MIKYRKKPVIIEAIQFTGHSSVEKMRNKWREDFVKYFMYIPYSSLILIHTLEGDYDATHSDWIIKGIAGEYYPCKSDIFKATYEKVEEK